MNYLFIGNGRIARHMSHYLSVEGHNVAVWSRRSTTDPQPLFNKAQIICISTRDHEISGVIEAYKLREFGKPLIHFSGSQYIEGAYGFHPLMSFGPELYSNKTYRAMHFVGVPPQVLFRKSFPDFKNNYHEIKPKDLALYHAYCSMAGNFPQILWSELSQKFESELNISDEALKPYLVQITENFIQSGKESITGPLARNEQRTLIRHLDALSKNSLQGIYFSFMNLFRKNNTMEKPHEPSGISTNQI